MSSRLMGLIVMLASFPALAGGFGLRVTVEEPSGLPRSAEPASGGIPLPAGTFKKDQPFAVYAAGQEVLAQVLPLVVDEKGYLRWVLVDLQTDLGARQKREFVLKAIAPAAIPATPLKVTDDASGVTVDTGKIRFAIAKDNPFSLFSAVEAGGKLLAGGGEVGYTEVTNADREPHRYIADKPSSIVVEYSGPMRATVCVKGFFAGDDQTRMRYIARITAWAGRSDVHVKYSLANSNEQHYCYRLIRDSSIELRLAGDASGALVGTSRPGEAAVPCWMQQSMRVVKAAIHGEDALGNAKWLHETPGAIGPGGAKAVATDKDLWASSGKGDVSEGWIAARIGGSGVFVTDLCFVEDPPRRLAVKRNAIVLSGITEPLEGTESPFSDKHRLLMDCSHLSSEYVLDFQAPAAVAELSLRAKLARGRAHVMAPLEWYFQSEALAVGQFGTRADEIACYDKWGWKYDPSKLPQGTAPMFTNMSRWTGGDDNHYTSEQDTLDSLLLMYLRTGHRSFYDAASVWANYFMDLEAWRTDGWRYKDGGVWWLMGGPLGNRPQRGKDAITGLHNSAPAAPWTDASKCQPPFTKPAALDFWFLGNAKQCYCHNWGEGLAEWFLLTGDRDALEAAIDCVEQNDDTQKRAFGKSPGKPADFSRDFTRSCYVANAVRLCVPTDPFVVEASDYLASVFLKRRDPEPRGFVNGPGKVSMKELEEKVGPKGIAKMKELGITLDQQGYLHDPKTGARWRPVVDPHTWMFPPLSRAMGTYWRIAGNEDALDWMIAYGQAAAHVLYQEKHGNLAYGRFVVDFPVKGFAWDRHSWNIPEGVTDGEGEPINGYLAGFHPDVCARAYLFCGEPLLKRRAYDFWFYGSHRGYNATRMHNVGGVGQWVNCYSTHGESVCFTGKTFYIWSHERKDDRPPRAVTDLKVAIAGAKATVSFTAPADEGGGKVVRYQLKCSDKPIVDYPKFLEMVAKNNDSTVTNWWISANVNDEPVPAAPGTKESFTVTGIPASARCFAIVSYDDSFNRSGISHVAMVGN
ncbi:MAG: hypothetical protein NTU53_18410 [Planctomycetota bacterium]|nr:hypothetical protein [Planctomycetota bacterium]